MHVSNCQRCCCCCCQVILEEAFPDLVEAGSGVDVRTAIEAPGNLQQVRQRMVLLMLLFGWLAQAAKSSQCPAFAVHLQSNGVLSPQQQAGWWKSQARA